MMYKYFKSDGHDGHNVPCGVMSLAQQDLWERRQKIPKDAAFWQAVHEYTYGLPPTVPTQEEWFAAHGLDDNVGLEE